MSFSATSTSTNAARPILWSLSRRPISGAATRQYIALCVQRSHALREATTKTTAFSSLLTLRWSSSDSNITYSGGQATTGQGGFYGSGGARSHYEHDPSEGRKFVLAVAGDVETIGQTMDEVERLESLLRNEEEEQQSTSVTSKSIEIKSSIKKLLTAKEFAEALNRLEVEGAPVWGLSTDEREMIVLAREKMTNC